MAQQPKVVKVGPGGRSNGPRPKVENPGKVLSRDSLLDMVRGNDADVAVFDRAIDSQISRLRRKLNTRTDETLIRTVRNEGYLLVPEVSLR